MRGVLLTGLLALVLFDSAPVRGDAPGLYGIHYWGYSGSLPVDPAPAQLLDVANFGAWDVEVANTIGSADVWWQPQWFEPLYQRLYQQNVSIITRLNYDWTNTLPPPTSPDYASFPSSFVSSVNSLSRYGHIWQLGNEPNLNGEAVGWANSHIDPGHYAQVYRQVHSALASATHSPAGPNELLVAPPSPGGVVPGVRWMDGTAWLSQVLTQIPHNEVDGISLHAYGGTVSDFRNSLLGQIKAIDQAGFGDKPLYLTEFDRYANPNSAADEAVSAQFVRDAYQFLNTWNQGPGNHNIVSASWFVYDSDNQSANQWNGYSIEYWKTHGNPLGSPGNLYTAFQQTVQQHDPAGVAGSRPVPSTFHMLENFEQGNGHFGNAPGYSPTTTGIDRTRSTAAQDTNDSYTQFASQKLTIIDDPSQAGGWRVRHLYNGGAPSSSPDQRIPITGGPDDTVEFFLRTSAPDLTVQMAFDPNGQTTPDSLIATIAQPVIADGQWHQYEWRLANPADFGPFPGTAGSGALPASGYLTLNSILINSRTDQNATLWLDTVAFNSAVPEPGTVALLIAAMSALRRRRA